MGGRLFTPPRPVFVGKKSLSDLSKKLTTENPLIVSDAGIVKSGIVKDFQAHYFKAAQVFSGVESNPSVKNVYEIVKAYHQASANGIIGIGGGGPMDAAKAAAWIIAAEKVDPKWKATSVEKVEENMKNFRQIISEIHSNDSTQQLYTESLPEIALIPTTSGTGSEVGKSAVISDSNHSKMIIGHPTLFATATALFPYYTTSLPPRLTTATAVDALLHSIEAYIIDDMDPTLGMSFHAITRCNYFADSGISLIVKHLPIVLKDPKNLVSRTKLQIASAYGGFAFAKGDLGGVHASAHALSAAFNLHHGEAIGRMAIHVTRFNETHGSHGLKNTYKSIKGIFKDAGFHGETFADTLHCFLDYVGAPTTIEDLKGVDIDALALAAFNDPCNTNPVPLTLENYKEIFTAATRPLPKPQEATFVEEKREFEEIDDKL